MGWADGRHALITGGGTGIGAATARALAAEGAKVTLLGRRREPLEVVAGQIGATAIACDVTDRGAIERAYDEARAANGMLDFAILNAGVGDSAPFQRTQREAWDRIIATNLTALFDGAQLALPDLLEGEDKRLVIVASVAGLKGAPYAAPYAASKHGAVGLTRALAAEYAGTTLRVNAVCPGFVDSDMTAGSIATITSKTGRSEQEARAELARLNPSGRLIAPAEIADLALALILSDRTGEAVEIA